MLSLQVGGMGCEACRHAVAGVLGGASGVLDARVRGTDSEGVADLLLNPEWGFDARELARRVRGAGFELDERQVATMVDVARRSDGPRQ